jgi:hypothetical protein
VYAHREDAESHARYRAWLEAALAFAAEVRDRPNAVVVAPVTWCYSRGQLQAFNQRRPGRGGGRREPAGLLALSRWMPGG